MKVFITGGTGFVGSRVAKQLAKRGDEVTILARSHPLGFEHDDNIRFVRGELGRLRENAEKILQGIDGVIHCGAHVSPYGNWVDFERANIHGTKELLDASLVCGIKAFVNFSTPSVYVEYQDKIGIREADTLPMRQVSMYGESKLRADELVNRAALNGLNACSLRPRGVIGAGDRNILPRMIRVGEKGLFPLVRGGQSLIDATVIDNLVDVTISALDRANEVRGEVFNISNGEPISLRNLAVKLFSALEMQVSFRDVPWPLAKKAAQIVETYFRVFKPGVEPPISVYSIGLTSFSQTLDISKARALLDYRPRLSLNEGIEQFVKWWTTENERSTTR